VGGRFIHGVVALSAGHHSNPSAGGDGV